MSQNQEDDQIESKEGLAKEKAIQKNSLGILKGTTFQGGKDNTKSLGKNLENKGGKLVLGRPESSLKDTPQNSSFVAEGHQIALVTQEDGISNGYSLDNKIQNTVDNCLSKKMRKTIVKDDGEDLQDMIDNDENITTRAIRACLAAETVIATLREECNLLPARDSKDKTKSGHARRGCNCLGKGATCNAVVSLQLQLAACENLSFSATAAFRELVASRLGINMSTPSHRVSPKKQKNEVKKSKKLLLEKNKNREFCQDSSNLQIGPCFGSILPITKRSTPARNISSIKEQLPLGPFSCSHPLSTYVSQCKTPFRSSSCDNAPITWNFEVPLLECYPGTLLNSKSILSRKTADALRAAMKRGVLVIIATGKTRPAAMAALDSMGLSGNEGIVSELTPGVFIQGLQVLGKKGKIIHNIALDTTIVEETFAFSVEHQAPLVGFCGDRCVTLFPHTLIEELHDVFYEPKAEVLECMDQMKKAKVQKVVFHDSPQKITSFLRPHWTLTLKGRANVVQSLPDMLEVLPLGASKGAGVQILLDHLEVPSDQVMAIGDGENDIEMLTLVGWGVAMGSANSVVKGVAKAVTTSNNEDGVAKAIEDYVL